MVKNDVLGKNPLPKVSILTTINLQTFEYGQKWHFR